MSIERRVVRGRFKTAAMTVSYGTVDAAERANASRPADWVVVELPGGSFGCGHPSAIEITPTHLPEPPSLSDHALSHVLSGVAEQERLDGRRLTDDELEGELVDLGYGRGQIEQVVYAHRFRCTTCGGEATHLYGALSSDGAITSMEGLDRLSPSCDLCSDPETIGSALGVDALVRAPLDFKWLPPYADPGDDRMAVARLVKRYVERVAEHTDYREDSVLINLIGDVRSMA